MQWQTLPSEAVGVVPYEVVTIGSGVILVPLASLGAVALTVGVDGFAAAGVATYSGSIVVTVSTLVTAKVVVSVVYANCATCAGSGKVAI